MSKVDFIQKFENNVTKDSYWKSYQEISEITGYSLDDTLDNVDSFDEFKRNSIGKFTTVKMYHEHTSFLSKLRDQMVNSMV